MLRSVRFDIFRPPKWHYNNHGPSGESFGKNGCADDGDDDYGLMSYGRTTSTVTTLTYRSDGDGARHATFAELFYDLAFFLPLHRLGLRCTDAENGFYYAFYFAAIFNAWVGEVFWNTRFDNDDRHWCICVHLCALSASMD